MEREDERKACLRGTLVGRHAECGVAEKHEFHSLKENAGRIPIVVRLQGREVFVLEIKTNGAGPAIAEPGLLRISERADEAIRERQSARLAAGVATDVGNSAVGASF